MVNVFFLVDEINLNGLSFDFRIFRYPSRGKHVAPGALGGRGDVAYVDAIFGRQVFDRYLLPGSLEIAFEPGLRGQLDHHSLLGCEASVPEYLLDNFEGFGFLQGAGVQSGVLDLSPTAAGREY